MHIRLVVHGDVGGSRWEFWKNIEEARAVPRTGDVVDLGVRTGAAPHLNERTIASVSWSPSLERVTINLDDLHDGWLQANRRALGEAGWIAAMAGVG